MASSKPQHDTAIIPPDIGDLCLDSRKIVPGEAFIALAGAQSHGGEFIPQAIKRGARVVLVAADEKSCWQARFPQAPLLGIKRLSQRVAQLVADFYAHPSTHLAVIGITGTNGKTSVAQFLAQCLTNLGNPCAALGTLDRDLRGNVTTMPRTTPDAVEVQRLLHQLLQHGAKTVVMEVSSHALAQQRVAAVNFTSAIFTNLTRDHLDYHADMTAYAAAKYSLFAHRTLRSAIFNIDDAYGCKWHHQFITDAKCADLAVDAVSLQQNDQAQVYARCWKQDTHGMTLELMTVCGILRCRIPLLGIFNVQNIALVVAQLMRMGYTVHAIEAALQQLQPIPGRMEMLRHPGAPLVVVDYAHTPEALAQALNLLRATTRGKIVLVFGCGGNRDRGKRPLMGKVAAELADRVVVTSDNPRDEDPQAIIDAILDSPLRAHSAVMEVVDRGAAIDDALSQAAAEDTILVAGKGHEQDQEIDGRRMPFNDQLRVMQALHRRWTQ